MKLKLDKTTKILLGAIALGLFLNTSTLLPPNFFYELNFLIFLNSHINQANKIFVKKLEPIKLVPNAVPKPRYIQSILLSLF